MGCLGAVRGLVDDVGGCEVGCVLWEEREREIVSF
jgi:hypothetical protein